MMNVGESRWYGRYRWMSLYDGHDDGYQYVSFVWCVSTSIFDVVDIGESPSTIGIRESLWLTSISQCPWGGKYRWVSLKRCVSVSVLDMAGICTCSHITIVSQFRTIAHVIRPTRHHVWSLHLTSTKPPSLATAHVNIIAFYLWTVRTSPSCTNTASSNCYYSRCL